MKEKQLTQFRLNLLTWFDKNKRQLPWRTNSNWYKTYLSEIILQQTTVDQGIPYFKKFLQRFPDIEVLAKADEQEVLLLWAGLGYYSRARNLLRSAKDIVTKFNCKFPQTYKETLNLAGIGPYSASAILSIAFNLPHAAVDGNVIRALSRIFAVKDDTRQIGTLKKLNSKAIALLDEKNPGKFNEAIMELGATVCLPKNAKCSLCPVKTFCTSYKKGLVDQIPLKSKAAPKHKRFHVAGIVKNGPNICIARKSPKGLLAGMWEFPVLELSAAQFKNGYSKLFEQKYKINGELKTTSQEMNHIYSHINLTYKAAIFLLNNKIIEKNGYQDLKWISIDEINNYAVHNAHKKIIFWYKAHCLKIKS